MKDLTIEWNKNPLKSPRTNTISIRISEVKIGDQVWFEGVIYLITQKPSSWICQQDHKTVIWRVPCKITEFSKKFQQPIESIRGLLYSWDAFKSIDDNSRLTNLSVIKSEYKVPLTIDELNYLKYI